MKKIRTQDAVGHVLCHDITQIIPGVVKDAVFRKGHVVTEADIPVLLSIGKEHLYIWEKTPGTLHENDAAALLYEICAGSDGNLAPGPVKEGKIEVIAQADGLFQIDTARLKAINSLGEMMIASRHTNSPVKKGDHLTGTRIIPLVIEEAKMETAKRTAGDSPLITLSPYLPKKYAIIATGSEVAKGLIEDKFSPVLRRKMAEYGGVEIGSAVLGDEPAAITDAINAFIEQGAQIVLCSGGMSVDPDDRTPLAIKNTGAEIISYGAPVLPGAMFMLSYHGKARIPVVGLPGCVMYAKRTVFDLVLPRLMANVEVTASYLAGLGHGGLCLNCETCIFPNCGFGAGI